MRAVGAPRRRRPPVLTLEDSSRTLTGAAWLLEDQEGDQKDGTRTVRLAETFIHANRTRLADFGIGIELLMHRRQPALAWTTSAVAGGLPLRSPLQARDSLGIVVQPRFGWAGIGATMAATGWREVPRPLRLPLVPASACNVPTWVTSSMLLPRLEDGLRHLPRRFDWVRTLTSQPRGAIDFADYAGRRLPAGDPLRMLCRHPDIGRDPILLGALRFGLEQHRTALQPHVALAPARGLLQRIDAALASIPEARSVRPELRTLAEWDAPDDRRVATTPAGRPMRDAMQAIAWTVEGRGLAGTSARQGLPWRLPLDRLFEAWVETAAEQVARRMGARLASGRRGQTTLPIRWQGRGTQRSLVPDLRIDALGRTIYLDAKYKRHAELLARHDWSRIDEAIRESHRHDLLQILAYGGFAPGDRFDCVLAYPLAEAHWKSLDAAGRTLSCAHIRANGRGARCWLWLVPLGTSPAAAAERLVTALMQAPAD